MAVSPRSRRRATNVDATPTVPEYETQARIFVRANKAKNEQASIEKVAKAETHKSMLAVNLNRFELLEGNKTYDCIIAGGTEDKVSTEKLYALVQDGTITLERFVKCVTATQKAIKDEFGTNTLNAVIVTSPTEVTLSIKERK